MQGGSIVRAPFSLMAIRCRTMPDPGPSLTQLADGLCCRRLCRPNPQPLAEGIAKAWWGTDFHHLSCMHPGDYTNPEKHVAPLPPLQSHGRRYCLGQGEVPHTTPTAHMQAHCTDPPQGVHDICAQP